MRGLSYNEIAKELGIEPSTVKYHVINMLQKTNLENKLQLAIAATEAKLVVELAEESFVVYKAIPHNSRLTA